MPADEYAANLEQPLPRSVARLAIIKTENLGMNNAIRSILSFVIPAMTFTLIMPIPPVVAAPSGRVAIVNAHSNLCLSPAGGSRDKNGEIVQFTCDQDPSRFWSFTVVEGDTVEITNLNSGLCLTIAGGNNERNIVSVQYTCDGDPSRRWRYTVVDAATFRLVNMHSGLCLTIAGGGTGRNTTAVQFPCDADPSRDWKIISGR
jgi:hypothetical protein